MNQAPAIYTGNHLIPSDHEMMVFHTMAEQAVTSKMYRGIGDKAGVMMVMLAAREMGIAPMAALNGGINLISGKVEISARMMSAMIRRAGHSIKPLTDSDTICTLYGKRCDNGDELKVSFTIEEAKAAGLVKAGGGWTKWPKDMLFARALSRLARQLFSDVIGIGYIEGEIAEPVGYKPKPTEEVMDANPTLMEAEDAIWQQQEVAPVQSEDELSELLINYFHKEDQILIVQYITAVMEHFGWDRFKALQELTKDLGKTQTKFEHWKTMRKS